MVNWQVVANIVHDIVDMGKWHQASKGEVSAAGLGRGEGDLEEQRVMRGIRGSKSRRRGMEANCATMMRSAMVASLRELT